VLSAPKRLNRSYTTFGSKTEAIGGIHSEVDDKFDRLVLSLVDKIDEVAELSDELSLHWVL
jgi:hypothetical protein